MKTPPHESPATPKHPETPVPPAPPATPPSLAPAIADQYNRAGVDFRKPIPRPKVNGIVVDFHCHLLANRHAPAWFEAADHYGIDCFVTMTPLEEVMGLQRNYPGRLQFIAVPRFGDTSAKRLDLKNARLLAR